MLSTGCLPLLRMILKMNSTFPNNIKSFVFCWKEFLCEILKVATGFMNSHVNKVFISKLSQKFRRDLLPPFPGTVQHKKKDNCIDIDYGDSRLQQKSLNI